MPSRRQQPKQKPARGGTSVRSPKTKQRKRPPQPPFDSEEFWEVILSPHVMSPVQLQSETLDAMRKAGTPPQIQYAFRKTGRLLTEANRRRCDPTLLKQWEDAIDEYFALSKDAKGRKRPDPRAWSSELPELLVRPLTKEDHDLPAPQLEAPFIAVCRPASSLRRGPRARVRCSWQACAARRRPTSPTRLLGLA